MSEVVAMVVLDATTIGAKAVIYPKAQVGRGGGGGDGPRVGCHHYRRQDGHLPQGAGRERVVLVVK